MAAFKRILVFSGLFLVAIMVSVAGLWYYIGRKGSTNVERWIAAQIVGVLESHITPKVTFAVLDYRAPRTVVTKDFVLIAQQLPIMSIDRMLLELAEVPREGQPIRVQKIELDNPHIKFVNGANGEFIGWQPFVRPDVLKDPSTVPPGRRFSDVLVLRHVAIKDGEILYDMGDGSEPMILPGIDMVLETPPLANEPGWYQLAGTLKREPLFHIDLGARINLDTAFLNIERLQFRGGLGEKEYGTLPPQAQSWLRQYDVHGQLVASARGEVPLNNVAESKGEVHATLEDGRLAYQGNTLPVSHAQLDANLPNGEIQFAIKNIALQHNGRPYLSIKQLAVSMLGLPLDGKPINISKLNLDQPSVALIRDTEKGGFIGWADLLRNFAGGSDAKDRKLSEIVLLQQLDIKEGAFRYQSGSDVAPFEIAAINLAVKPSAEQLDNAIFKYDATLLEGRTSGQGSIQLKDSYPLTLDWNIDGVRLEQMLRNQDGGASIAGRMTSQGRLTAQLQNFSATVSGTGRLSVDEGRLMNLPLIRELLTMVAKVNLGVQLAPRDKAHVEFQLRPDHAQIIEMEVTSALVGLRGNGRIFYDSRLDMDVNARVAEPVTGFLNNLGGTVGKVGELIGAVGDKVVTYHVTGTWSQPQVTIKPLGLGR